MADAASAWLRVTAAASITDPIGHPGTGLVALGTFAFPEFSDAVSVLVVPRIIVGRAAGVAWITRVGVVELPPLALPSTIPLGPEYRISLLPGALAGEGYREAVASAVSKIRARELSKVVLARDLVGHLPAGSDLSGSGHVDHS